jgi:hypothetical protein
MEVAILNADTMVTMTTRDAEMFALSIHLYKTVATLKPQATEVPVQCLSVCSLFNDAVRNSNYKAGMTKLWLASSARLY